MGMVSDGAYGFPEGLVASYPVTVDAEGVVEIVPDLDVSAIAKGLEATSQELLEERQALVNLGFVAAN